MIDEALPKSTAVAGVVHGLHHGLPHQTRRSDGTIQAGVVHHVHDGGDATPLIADAMRPSPHKLHLARGVAVVAQLVFKTLKFEPIAAATGSPSRQEETGQPGIGLR